MDSGACSLSEKQLRRLENLRREDQTLQNQVDAAINAYLQHEEWVRSLQLRYKRASGA